jgi:glycosyltransferase involved in cell wall biosynthesis
MARIKKQNVNRNRQNYKSISDKLRVKLAHKKGEKTICLTMIVKNESANMVRLFNSVKQIIDMISIVDTGSTDDTVSTIEKWGSENKIPTKVHYKEFKNFAYNRTHSVTAAKMTYPEVDYFLLSDADFEWEINVNHKFDKVLLTEDKYLVNQYNKSLKYFNIRLLSSKLDWECVGRTHEYWRDIGTGREIRSSRLTTLVINDHEDGGCKENKFSRDEKLLKEGLSDPDEEKGLKTRYKFYLGQTLSDIGRFEDSNEWYKKRIDDGGWDEEVYYSHYKIGCNYELIAWKKLELYKIISKQANSEELTNTEDNILKTSVYPDMTLHQLKDGYENDFKMAEKYYMDGYKMKKNRAESLYHLAKMYRMRNMYQSCYDTCQIGKRILYPEYDNLFIQHAVYSYKFDFELCIICYYLKKMDEGQDACRKILLMDDIPDYIIRPVKHNSKLYL